MQFPAEIALAPECPSEAPPSLACRVALVDLTAEKHYTPVLNKFSSHRKYPHSR